MPTHVGSLQSLLHRLLAALACLCALVCLPLQASGLVTIVDGEATLVEGARAIVAAEGLKLGDETLVRTGPRTNLLRVEWPDGTAADFGPDTQAMLGPAAFGPRGKPTTLYLLRGWVKLSSLGGAPVPGMVSTRIDMPPFKGALVAMVSAAETWVFAETGALQLTEREIKPASSASLKNGEVYVRDGPGKGGVSPRPSPAQLQRVPRGFRDALPLRTAALKGRAAEARPAPAPTYAELREWLLAEPALRKGMPKRFAERAKDSAFRASLVEQLGVHPDWEAVLFPERFTKPAGTAR